MEPPLLDHVSLVADPRRIEAMGFELTPTAGAEDRARVFLDRAYLEVRLDPDSSGLDAFGWFLRVPDLGEAAGRLRAAGVAVADPARFEGADGSWVDLAPAPVAGAALPTITRRQDLPADSWPPPLARPHPNGATRLAAVDLRTVDPAPLEAMLLALGARRGEDGSYELGAGARVRIETGAAAAAVAGLRFEASAGPEQPLAQGGDVAGGEAAAGEGGIEVVLQ